MKLIGLTLLLGLLLATSLCPSGTSNPGTDSQLQKAQPVSVTYIGNEGVLLSTGDKQVLIDALHREYKPAYAFPPAAVLESLESAKAPYDKIRLILVTHVHLDHFHPVSVGLHLQNNRQAELVSSDQIADSVKKEFAGFSDIESRVKRVPYLWQKKIALNAQGIQLKGLGLKHANPQFSWIQNLGYIVELNGKKFLHIGDADMTVENFSSLNLPAEGIDVAFVPYWFLLSESGRAIVENEIHPKHVVAVHVSQADAVNVADQVKRAYPGAVTLTTILERKDF